MGFESINAARKKRPVAAQADAHFKETLQTSQPAGIRPATANCFHGAQSSRYGGIRRHWDPSYSIRKRPVCS